MSSFGGENIDMNTYNIDYLISSSNKCLHGPPGVSFCIANKEKLKECKNISGTLSLDLYDQWKNFEETSQFRFTPPTYVLSGFNEAINEFNENGGLHARKSQYKSYNTMISNSLKKRGFKKYELETPSNIISTWYYLNDTFNYEKFYNYLNEKDIVIYNGKLSNENVFRIGNIGNISVDEINYVTSTIDEMDLSNFS